MIFLLATNVLFVKFFRLSTSKFKTYQFQRKDRSRGNRILSNTLVALRQFPRIRCLIRTLQGRHSFLSNFSLTAIDRSNQRCKDFRGRVDKPRNWYNFFIIFKLLLRIRRYSRRYILDKNRVWRSYLHLSYPGYRTISWEYRAVFASQEISYNSYFYFLSWTIRRKNFGK